MADETNTGIIHPPRPVPKKYIPAILFLADKMSKSDAKVVAKEMVVINDLAETVNMRDFRNTREYGQFTDEKACESLDIKVAKRAALVVIALVLKADVKRKDIEHQYFKKIRQLLKADPIIVPIDLEDHKNLALEYFRK